MSFTLTGWMLYAMWGVLGMMSIKLLAEMYQSVSLRNFPSTAILNFLQGFVYYVFPLFIIANIASIDPTEIIVQIAYYVGAIGVIVKSITDIRNLF